MRAVPPGLLPPHRATHASAFPAAGRSWRATRPAPANDHRDSSSPPGVRSEGVVDRLARVVPHRRALIESSQTITNATMSEIPQVLSVLLLDAEGKRVAVKYWDEDMTTVAQQMAHERSVFAKTSRNNARGDAEIALLDQHVLVYKFAADLHFYVCGAAEENEIILATVLNGFFDAVSLLLRGVLEKRTALENLDLVLLAIDELVDGGVILETDANVIANRVSMRGVEGEQATPLAEQTLSQALATAKEQITRNLLR